LWPSTTVPKLIHFRSVINFPQRSAFWDLADFSPIFRVSELPKVCAFISQKLSKLCPLFFIFPDNFYRSIRIWKNIPPEGRGSGATVPPKRSQSTKFQNFHFFARPLCLNDLRQQLRTGFILHPTGPASERPYAFEGRPLNFGPRPFWAAQPQKSFSQISQKS